MTVGRVTQHLSSLPTVPVCFLRLALVVLASACVLSVIGSPTPEVPNTLTVTLAVPGRSYHRPGGSSTVGAVSVHIQDTNRGNSVTVSPNSEINGFHKAGNLWNAMRNYSTPVKISQGKVLHFWKPYDLNPNRKWSFTGLSKHQRQNTHIASVCKSLVGKMCLNLLMAKLKKASRRYEESISLSDTRKCKRISSNETGLFPANSHDFVSPRTNISHSTGSAAKEDFAIAPPSKNNMKQEKYTANRIITKNNFITYRQKIPFLFRRYPIHRLSKRVTFSSGRRRVSWLEMREFPYSNIVRLSTSCTGTLLTPRHVLTAAHCVHNGHRFRKNLDLLRIEVPDPFMYGSRAVYLDKISVPARWRHPRSPLDHPESWDYAIVTLSFPVHGRTHFHRLSVPSEASLEHDLTYLGFVGSQLWRSVCASSTTRALVGRSLIFTQCYSVPGNSGAAVLATEPMSNSGRSWHKGQIIGVLSSNVMVRPGTQNTSVLNWLSSYSVISAFTWTKLWDVCRELGHHGVIHGVCPPPKTFTYISRYHENSIPYFG